LVETAVNEMVSQVETKFKAEYEKNFGRVLQGMGPTIEVSKN